MKILDRGYWVSKLFFGQSTIYFICNVIRFRSLSFFSALNPAINLGGLLDDKKSDTNKLIPKKYLPKSFEINSLTDAKYILGQGLLSYPLIIKPDIGLKGNAVTKIDQLSQLQVYFEKQGSSRIFLLQEFVDLEEEYSFLYYRIPNTDEYGISSLTRKEYPYVIGDGRSTVHELIQRNKNPFLQKKQIQSANYSMRNKMLKVDEKYVIEKIGNYSRGSKFYSVQQHIDKAITQSGKALFDQMIGMDFARVDLKTDSLDHLRNGDFKIMEINGAKSEPLHIYDPGLSWIYVIKEIHHHWKIISKILAARMDQQYELPKSILAFKGYQSLKKVAK